jgi:hypothetical protein
VNNTTQRPAPSGVGFTMVGTVLFVIGGMVLEDALGGDGLVFVGLLCLALGLVGLIAGGVALGTPRSD